MATLGSWVAGGAHRRDRDGDGYYDQGAPVALMDAWWKRLAPAIFAPALADPVLRAVSALASYDNPAGPQGDAFYGAFYSYVQKDLRDLVAQQSPAAAPRPACRIASGHGRRHRRRLRRCARRRGQGQGQVASARPRSRRPGHRIPSARPAAFSDPPLLAPWHRVYCGNGSLVACRALLIETLRQAAADLTSRYHSSDPAQWRVPATCTPGQNPPACDQIEFTAAGAISTPSIPWQNRGTFQQAVDVPGHRPR
jgi:hypothetical protein